MIVEQRRYRNSPLFQLHLRTLVCHVKLGSLIQADRSFTSLRIKLYLQVTAFAFWVD